MYRRNGARPLDYTSRSVWRQAKKCSKIYGGRLLDYTLCLVLKQPCTPKVGGRKKCSFSSNPPNLRHPPTSRVLYVTKTAVITGGNTGLGKETAVRLAQLGADVTIACRNPDKAFAALEDIKAQAPGAQVG